MKENRMSRKSFNYHASVLTLTNLLATIHIYPTEDNDERIRVLVEGGNEIREIEGSVNEDTLTIQGPKEIIQQGGSSIHISNSRIGGGVFLTNNRGSCLGNLFGRKTVSKKPSQNDVEGYLILGNINGDISLNFNGSCDTHIGSVKNLRINSTGTSNINVHHIDGNLDMFLIGSGDIEVCDGSIPSFNLFSTGSGNVYLNTSVKESQISLMGSGDILVKSIETQLSFYKSGMGDLTIRD
jgi:hypothetical protein